MPVYRESVARERPHLCTGLEKKTATVCVASWWMCIAGLSSNHSVGSSEGARDLLWNLWESSATVTLPVIPLAMCLETRHPAYLELLCPPQQEASRPRCGNLRLLCWSGVQCLSARPSSTLQACR